MYYNEQKVKAGQAQCIYAGNFLPDAADLTPGDKRRRFSDVLQLNQRVVNTAMHIVLQFPPGEDLDNDRLIAITASYMQRIGYGDQPYLVYRHSDTASPHLHIVTITIRPDGSHIRTPFLGPRISEPARKAVEIEFGLTKASGHKRKAIERPGPAQKIQYGKLPSEEAIANTLSYILETFRYRSIAELNAILRLYNLTAKTGRPGSRLHTFGGLLYQILDEKGQGRGAPVKASSLPFKPTLSWLETKFAEHRLLPPATVNRTRFAFDSVLRENPADGAAFRDALRRNQLAIAGEHPSDGSPTGLLLVNLAEKTVIPASELGAAYDLPALRQKLSFDPLQISITETRKQGRQRKQQKIHL